VMPPESFAAVAAKVGTAGNTRPATRSAVALEVANLPVTGLNLP
jgi:hypothetical protein